MKKNGLLVLFFLVRLGVFCSAEETSAVDDRQYLERQSLKSGLFVLPHKANYFLFSAYNSNPNQEVYRSENNLDIDHNEVKFQLSIKVVLGRGMINGKGNINFAYTQLSLWQLYNRNYSSPFRETNHEPEIFMDFDTDVDLGPVKNKIFGFGLVHQSNGQTEPLSRSWNRLYSLFILEKGRFIATLKPWYRFPESSSDDDNPNIERYLGYGELRLAFDWKRYLVSLMLRNNLRAQGNKGAIEFSFSFPLTESLKGYLQYFNGYGETLIDYNHPNNRIGLGIALSDWL